MANRVLSTLALPDPFNDLVSPLGEILVMGRIPSRDELAHALGAVEFAVLCPQVRDRVDAKVLDAAGPSLRAVCTYSVGYNNVDVEAASARGIAVANTPGVLTDATADCALGLILAAARRLVEGDRAMRSGQFGGWEPEYMLGLELRDSDLGIVGFGRIGQAVARRALAFGMRVSYVSGGSTEVAADLAGHCRQVDLDTLLSGSDVVSLHCPLNASTHHLINRERLRRMRNGAVLINTARGPIIDEPALVEALRQGWIAGAGLDVYENEPELATGLVELANVVLSPHLGSATGRTRAAMAELCGLNTAAALRNEVPPHCVNREAATRLAG